MKKLWKKPAVKVAAAAVIVAGLGLLGLWIWSLRAQPDIMFDFLNGRTVTARIEQYPGSSPARDIMEVYSFESDYETVSKNAFEELSGLGFRSIGSGLIGSRSRQYVLVDTTSRVKVMVTTFNKRKCVPSSTQKPSAYSSGYGYESEFLEGWVTVEVRRWPLRLWPPQHLLFRLKRHLQAVRNPPPQPSFMISPQGSRQKKP